MKRCLLLALFLLSSTRLLAQNNGALLPAIPPSFNNASGIVAANGKLCFTRSGTSTSYSVYSDAALTSALPNPVTLNALGTPQTGGGTSTSIYMQPQGPYRVTLYGPGTGNTCNGTTVGAQIWQRDGIYDPALLPTFDNIRLCDRFPGSTAGAKLTACYADLPSTGGLMFYCSVGTISSAITFAVVTNKPATLDLCGQTITMTHTTGVGITISHASGVRTPFRITNGKFVYSGSSANITGVRIANLTYSSLDHLQFYNFNSTGATAVLWDNVEDSSMDMVEFNGNTTGLLLTNTLAGGSTNQNRFQNSFFQGNSVAVLIKEGSSGNTFQNDLFQSNTAAHAVQMVSAAADTNTAILSNSFIDNWFENNGDTTANACQLYVESGVARSIQNLVIKRNSFTLGANGAAGKHYCFVNAGSFAPPVLESNSYGGGSPSFGVTGIVVGLSVAEGQTGNIVLSSDLFLKTRASFAAAEKRLIGVDSGTNRVEIDKDSLGVNASSYIVATSLGIRSSYPPAVPLDVQMANAAFATLGGFTTPSMTDNQQANLFIGKSSGGNSSFYVTYNHNATATSRYLALYPSEGATAGGLIVAANADTTANVGINTALPIPARLTVTGNVAINGTTPAGTAGYLTLGSADGFGTGAAGTAVTTTTKGGGTGPTTPQTIVDYLQIRLGTNSYWIPLVQ